MPRGYRYVLIAAFGWLTLAAAPTPKSGAKAEQANASERVERSLEAIANSQAAAVEQAKPGEYEAPCADGDYNNQSDLCAQWHAARAARDAADWSAWTFFLGIGSLILSLGGLYVVVKSLQQADKSLAEAGLANEINRNNAMRESRAYVGAVDFSIEDFSPGKIPRSKWILKNFGLTPAFDVQTIAAIFITDRDEKIRFRHTFNEVRDVQPGQAYEVPYFWPIEISPIYANAFQNDEASFIYAGVIRYRDAFGKRRYTTFKKKAAIQALPGGGGDGPLINCIRGNRSN